MMFLELHQLLPLMGEDEVLYLTLGVGSVVLEVVLDIGWIVGRFVV